MVNEKILTLSYFLRESGMNVSIRSTILASDIWNQFYGQFDSDELKYALKCVYVKSKDDLARYERAYNYVFVYNKKIECNSHDQDHIDIKSKKNHDDSSSEKNKKPVKDTTRETIIRRRLKMKENVDESILDDEFISLDNIDYRVFDVCHDFSKKVANRRSIRKKRHKTKGVHIPHTIRKNLKNGVLESATVLHRIVIKSRKVIILNPEKKIRWNTPTSCVKDYQEAGATVYQTSTLREFSDVIEKI